MGNLITRITDCQRRMKTMFEVFDGAPPRVLLLGLDGAGKTTLLYSTKLDDYIFASAPPKGSNIEHITPRRGATLQVFDFPGSKLARHLWHNWFNNTEAIVFVVDSADKVRIDEAKFELHDMLTSRWLRKVPLIVAANKQDLPDCMAEDQVAKELELESISNRDWSIIGVSAAKKQKGISKIFDDAVDMIVAYRHYKSSLTEKQSDKKHTVNKDSKNESKKEGVPAFTSIEDADAMQEETIPSLFGNIKASENDKFENGDELTDSGLSSRESVTYDQMDVGQDGPESVGPVKPDSVKDDGESIKSVQEQSSSDSGHGDREQVTKETQRQVSSSEDSNTTDDVSDVSEEHINGESDSDNVIVDIEKDQENEKNVKSTDNDDVSSVSVEESEKSEDAAPNTDTQKEDPKILLDDAESDSKEVKVDITESVTVAESTLNDSDISDAIIEGEEEKETVTKTSLNVSDISDESIERLQGEEMGDDKNDVSSIESEEIGLKHASIVKDDKAEMVTDLDNVSDEEEVDLV